MPIGWSKKSTTMRTSELNSYSQYVSDIRLIGKDIGVSQVLSQSIMHNTSRIFEENCKINSYQICLLITASCGSLFRRTSCLFSQKAVNSVLYALHSLRVSSQNSSAGERIFATAYYHNHPWNQVVLLVSLNVLFWSEPSMQSLPRKHSCKHENLR